MFISFQFNKNIFFARQIKWGLSKNTILDADAPSGF